MPYPWKSGDTLTAADLYAEFAQALSVLPNLSAPVLLTAPSGNYTVPAGVYQLRGAGSGAGGGGGGVSAAPATGSAGLAGMQAEFAMAVVPGQVIPYSCGAGGTRGANTGVAGGTGGDTTFGPFTFKGGAPGAGSTGGNGAAVGVASVAVTTMISGSALIPTAGRFITARTGIDTGLAGAAGVGGQAKGIWGTGGTPGTNGSATDATGFGAGGSGAGSTSNTAGTGGLGAPGAIVLY
jgi:hypothetical protein